MHYQEIMHKNVSMCMNLVEPTVSLLLDFLNVYYGFNLKIREMMAFVYLLCNKQ